MKNLNLIAARKNMKMTQQELANKTKAVTKATISNWENGYSRPRLEIAILVAEILKKDVSFLFKD
ncbi:MAG TPA: helix-turn-helix transcriptional regulator [Kurthia gibsonii]|uniref:helix-turn-helix transcriptional regulator n=1 Tax=Kurthia gibsonii TaxID=33946 RepID=UPI002D423F72|nr:helix-turn-helix transcriptional regulator [Kurthia gibsonii]